MSKKKLGVLQNIVTIFLSIKFVHQQMYFY